MASMAMNMVTEIVTPAMQTRDWRLWEKKYLVEMNQRIVGSGVRVQGSGKKEKQA
jgi:hypothetical protein